jgi:hypothetical protein
MSSFLGRFEPQSSISLFVSTCSRPVDEVERIGPLDLSSSPPRPRSRNPLMARAARKMPVNAPMEESESDSGLGSPENPRL